MYLVDTSIWIHALRPTGNAEIQARLKPLIVNGQTAVTEWILLELMTGLVKSEQPSSLLQWFTPVPRLPFNPEWWDTAWDLAGRLRRHGVSPSAAVCLIATIAMKHQAVSAFRRALQVPSTSSKEQVQILYLLGRTLESLDRIPEALEAYRWLRREAPQYRDVAMRIQSLSTRRMHTDNRSPWATQASQMWQGLRARIIHEGLSRKRADAK